MSLIPKEAKYVINAFLQQDSGGTTGKTIYTLACLLSSLYIYIYIHIQSNTTCLTLVFFKRGE